MARSIITSSSSRILVPQFYVGVVSSYDDVGVGDVKLVFSSRFEGVESTGFLSDIISSDEEFSFLEKNLDGAVRSFEDTLAMFGKQGYELYNGITFQVGYEGILPVPYILELRIQRELLGSVDAQRVMGLVVPESTYLQ